jgi:steroid 5-alpha reductase family enzyme
MTAPWLVPLYVLLVLGALLWLLSLRMQNTGIVDIFWGPMFAVTAGLGYALGTGEPSRKLLALALTLAWSGRLAVHLALRNLGHAEDPRYAAMRRHHGRKWAWLSWPMVFVLQPVLSFIVAMPLTAALHLGQGRALSPLDGLAASLALLGILLETLADAQLVRFKADANNQGRVLARGLWRYSRHPNYFGDFLVWCGLGLLGVAAGAAWSLLGTLLMTVLLLRVSGVTLLEKTIVHRRPEYADYIRNTNAFFPGPPRGGRA